MFCGYFEITPVRNKVTINKIPYNIQENILKNPIILKELQENYEVRNKYWCYPSLRIDDCTNTQENNFPDPSEYVIGFNVTTINSNSSSKSKSVKKYHSKKTFGSDTKEENKLIKNNEFAQKFSPNYLIAKSNSKKMTGISSEMSSKFSCPSNKKQSPLKILRDCLTIESGTIGKKLEVNKKKSKQKKNIYATNRVLNKKKETGKTQDSIYNYTMKTRVSPLKKCDGKSKIKDVINAKSLNEYSEVKNVMKQLLTKQYESNLSIYKRNCNFIGYCS